MKRGQFSYQNVQSQSHASLNKFKKQDLQTHVDSLSRGLMGEKPNVKYFTNPSNKSVQKTQNNNKSDGQEVQLWKNRYEECAVELEKMVEQRNEQQTTHTEEIEKFMNVIDKTIQKHEKQLRNLRDEHQEKEKMWNQSKKKEDERRILLEQIRKKYQEQQKEQKVLFTRSEKLKQEKENLIREHKLENQKQQKQKNEMRLSFEDQIHSYRQQIENLTQKITEISIQNEKQRKTILNQEEEISALLKQKKQFQEQTFETKQKLENEHFSLISEMEQLLEEKKNVVKNLSHECQSLKYSLEEVQQKNVQQQKIIYKKQVQLKNIHQNLQNLKQNKKQIELNLNELQRKFHNQVQELKKVQFTNTENEQLVEKLKKNLQVKGLQNQNLENEKYAIDKKHSQALQKCKQLQKKLSDIITVQQNNHKIELQNYKVLGRLIQISNKLRSLSKNPPLEEEPQQLQKVVIALTHSLDQFLIYEYQPLLNQNSQLQEHLEQISQQFKTILYHYNNFVGNSQLTDLLNEYLSEQMKKNIRQLLTQSIIEKLISMNAIKSYTSDKTSNQKMKTQMDSLEDTRQNLKQSQRQSSLDKWISGHEVWRNYYHKPSDQEPKRQNIKKERIRRDNLPIRQSTKKQRISSRLRHHDKQNKGNFINTEIGFEERTKNERIELIEKKYFR